MKIPLSAHQADAVMSVLSRSNFPDLAAETVMEALEAEGIRTLEDLARSLTSAMREPAGGPQSRPAQGTPRRDAADGEGRHSAQGA
jgi:hypothetical protein